MTGSVTVISIYKKQDIPYSPLNLFVYIGRGSYLGNPFTHLSKETKATHICTTKAEAISSYEVWLLSKLKAKAKNIRYAMNLIWLMANRGFRVHLECYCAPRSCHGDVIKKIIDSKLGLNKKQ